MSSTIDWNTGGYTYIFSHGDPVDCPLTGCYLFMNDCSSPISPAMTHVTLGADPYVFTVYKGVKLGWTADKFCYKC